MPDIKRTFIAIQPIENGWISREVDQGGEYITFFPTLHLAADILEPKAGVTTIDSAVVTGKGKGKKSAPAPVTQDPVVSSTVGAGAATDTAPAPVVVAAPPVKPATPAPDAVPTEADVVAAMSILNGVAGLQGCRDALARFGVKRQGELLPKQRADFIKYVGEETEKANILK